MLISSSDVCAGGFFEVFQVMGKHVVGAADLPVLHLDAFLLLEAVDELFRFLGECDLIGKAVDHQACDGTRGEECEIVHTHRGCDDHESDELRTTHQQLHGDPCPESIAGNPEFGGEVGGSLLEPVERAGGIREFSLSAVKFALGAPHATEVDPQRRIALFCEGLGEAVGDGGAHGASQAGVRG